MPVPQSPEGERAIELSPIGVIHTPYERAPGTPIQPRFAGGAQGRAVVFAPYVTCLADLDGFERIWLLYWLDRAAPWRPSVVPYMDHRPRGLFATRAPSRPNPIGMSCVRLVSVVGDTLHVADVDMLDGTPLLDIKPYAPRFDCYEVARSGWLDRVSGRDTSADDRFH